MNKPFAAISVVAIFTLCSFAQTVNAQCPVIDLPWPEDVTAGQPITFRVSITGVDPDGYTYDWSISAGALTGGQGTTEVTMDSEGLGGESVTATVEIGGLPPECNRTASASLSVKKLPVSVKIDEYSGLKAQDEEARLDLAVIDVQSEPMNKLYVIAYGGRKTRPGYAAAALNRVKTYMVTARGFDVGRITTIDGGHKEIPTVELWIVMHGAIPPTATPTVAPADLTPPKPKTTPTKKT